MKRAFAVSVLVQCLALSGCGAPDDTTTPVAPAPDAGSGGAPQSGGSFQGGSAGSPESAGTSSQGGSGGAAQNGSAGAGTKPVGRQRCVAPPGMGSPGTIQDAVALLNALPKPTSVACFVESLDRPLAMNATSSLNSAQPAFSAASPRVFLKIGQLWLSVVVDGESSELLEFGYLLSDPLELRSIKGELHFPLPSQIAPSAPFDGVMYGAGSVCRLCHFAERAESVPGLQNVFSSAAFKPRPETRVPLESLRAASQVCNWQVEPTRCEMLSALFDGGPVVETGFPQEMPTFF